MFLVKDRRLGLDRYVFMMTDPRLDGYRGEVTEGVTLEFDQNHITLWPDGEQRPHPQLGCDPMNPKHYKVFKFPEGRRSAAFELIHDSVPLVPYTWSDYRAHYYPVPEEFAKNMTSDEWFDFLEEADSATIIRKERIEPTDPKPGSTREQIAEWVAKQHAGSDGGVRQVWFLPANSPADEIRLLEISERYTGEPDKIEPVDFSLNVANASFKLAIADISGARLEKIKSDPSRWLPNDWSLNNSISWSRRELGQ